MNLPHRNDRRRSTVGLLHTLGFTHVMFPNVTLASDIDPDALVENQFVRPEAIDAILAREDKGPGALRAYLANALDQVSETAPASLANVLQLSLWWMFALASNQVFCTSDILSCARSTWSTQPSCRICQCLPSWRTISCQWATFARSAPDVKTTAAGWWAE